MASHPNNFLSPNLLPTFSFNSTPGFPPEDDQPRGRGRSASFYAVSPPSTEITIEKPTRQSKRFRVGTADTIGRRKMMEDVTVVHGRFRDSDEQDLFAVFDGHGGKEAAEYAGSQLATVLADILDKQFVNKRPRPSGDAPAISFSVSSTSDQSRASPSNSPGSPSTQDPAEIPQVNFETSPPSSSASSSSSYLLATSSASSSATSPDSSSYISPPSPSGHSKRPGSPVPESSVSQTSENSDTTVKDEKVMESLENLSPREEIIKEALQQSFHRLNELLIEKKITSGTTACVALIDGKTLYIANVGDTRAVLYRNGKAHRLSVDHKPNLPEEKSRIESVGGFVTGNNRVNGMLAVSRALGDAILQPSVSPDPFISVTHLTDADKFLIIACDGLWDIFSDDLAVEIVKEENDPIEACTKLRDRAYNSGCTDNISVEMIYFK